MPAEVFSVLSRVAAGDAKPIEWHPGGTDLHSRWRYLLAVFAIVLIFSLFGTNPAHTQTAPGKSSHAASKPANADLALVDLAGYQQVLAKYCGKPLVVNFWATWCPPCRDEYPMIVELAKQFKTQGVSVVGINMDDNSDMNLVRHFLARTQPGFPNYRQKPGIDLDAFYQAVNPAWHGTMPQTVFYGRDGRIAGYFVGTRPRPEFEQAFRDLIASRASANQGGNASASGKS
jgi:thiol-disulfide isomerase/thioredoxin